MVQLQPLSLKLSLVSTDGCRLGKTPETSLSPDMSFPFPPSLLYSSHPTVKDLPHLFQRSLSLKTACAFFPRSGVPFRTLTAYYARYHMIPIAGLS